MTQTFFKTAVSILLTSNHNSFRVLFDKIAFVYFIRKIGYIYILALEMASPWNQHLCHTLSFPMTKASDCPRLIVGAYARVIMRILKLNNPCNFPSAVRLSISYGLQLYWLISLSLTIILLRTNSSSETETRS